MPTRICPTCQEEVHTDDLFCPRDGTRLLKPSVYEQIAAETDPLVGTRIADRYLVIRKVGEGGMGDVYLGEHEDIEKQVAIKVLKQEYSSRTDIVARFRQEAVSASRIKHPNVVDVFDFGQLDDGRFYLAMEWLDGQDLATLLGTEGKLRPARAIPIAVQACKALEAAHRSGVIHRDLKPENIFLVRTEEDTDFVKIVDFGIAKLKDEASDGAREAGRKLTKTGMVFGTPEYMSPEQAKGQPADKRSDVYAMGIVLFEMLTGQVPFFGDTFLAVLTAHLTQTPPKLNDALTGGFVSGELERVVAHALEKAPDNRYPDMGAFRRGLLETPEGKVGQIPREPKGPSQAPIALVKPKEKPHVRVGADAHATPMGTTQLAVTALDAPQTQDAPPIRRKRSVLLPVAIVTMLAGAAAVVVWYGKSSPRPAAVATSEPVPPPASSSASATKHVQQGVGTKTSTTPSASPSASASGVTTMHPSTVIHIVTKPPGAVVMKRDGKALFQVCASSPCDYPARPDEKVTFVATLRGAEGSGSVLARTSQDLLIVLRPRKRPHGKPTPTKAKQPEKHGMCKYCLPKGDPDCLYVLRPCGQ